ncbi:CoA pyrophosphatase [Persicobacter sp. CCB-QB2]|uniref:NUDIX hydrolase n=1 Tax=Persicobacter sp. CCB-QB2 TaxID=1561025 RepID=UPI0006A97540|nr:CoA pyrophosphatase [Persicobacter sp. CCB-QB2]
MNYLNGFLAFLEQRLESPLPGEEAQKIMAPLPDKQLRFKQQRTGARESAVLINFLERNGRILFPLIQRPKYDGAHSGQVALPGGKKDVGDPNLDFTALREAEEEIGLPRKVVSVHGQLTNLYIPVSNFMVTPVLGSVQEEVTFVPDDWEVDDILMCDLMKLIESPAEPMKTTLKLPHGPMEVPYFDIHGKIVWGATAIILSELKALCSPYFH